MAVAKHGALAGPGDGHELGVEFGLARPYRFRSHDLIRLYGFTLVRSMRRGPRYLKRQARRRTANVLSIWRTKMPASRSLRGATCRPVAKEAVRTIPPARSTRAARCHQ